MKIRPIWGGLIAAALSCWCASAHAEQYTIPLFVGASPGGAPQGVLRLANDADTTATISIQAIDDTGLIVGLATLTLNASAAMDLTATDLASGNAAKGLAVGFGPLGGNVRLVIDSDLPIVPSAYVRGADGALAPMNATVPATAAAGSATGTGQNPGASSTPGSGQSSGAAAAQTAYRHDIALFHPAGNATQPSRLRLINPGDTAAQVTVEARDDFGTPASGGAVQLTLPTGNARTLTAQQLESGDAGADAALTGRLGAGVGNWRLAVLADRPIDVVHLTVGPAGDWHNLSTTAIQGWAPADAAAFEARFLDQVIVDREGQSTGRPELQVQADGRIRRTVRSDGAGVTVYEGPYRYERVGRDAGRLTLSGDGTEWYLYFSSPSSGRYSAWTIDRASGVESWSGGAWSRQGIEAMPPDLGLGPSSLVFALGAAIDPATLPGASGGDGELVYSLSPQVPGLSFDPATRELSGTPTESGRFLATYRATDAAGASDRRYFTINVLDEDGGGDPGSVLHETGGTLSDLPAGEWEPDVLTTGRVTASGDSTEVEIGHLEYFEQGDNRYTCLSAMGCTVRDRELVSGSILQGPVDTGTGGTGNGGGPGDGDDHSDDRASATPVAAGSDTPGRLDSGDTDWFRIDMDGPGRLEVYTSGGVDTTGRLEDAGGGIVGSGDDFGADINFRIEATVSAGTYYVAVRGFSPGDTGAYTLHAHLTATPPSFAGARLPGDRAYTVGAPIAALTLPQASGGNGRLLYSLAPNVPGLTFDAAARQLSGTPTRAGDYSMTYTVRDSDGDTDSLRFTIAVNAADPRPSGDCRVGLSVSPGESCLDRAANTTFTVQSDGTAQYRFISAGNGITMNDFKATHQGNGVWRIDGVSGGAADTSPSFSGSQANLLFTENSPISTVTLPAASGGNGSLTYSLSPSVPGLTFTASNRQLSGTPTRAGTYRMTYTVRDNDNDNDTDTDTRSFTISVASASAPTGGGARDGDCYVGLLVNPGESCAYPGTNDRFTVTADGTVRFLSFVVPGGIGTELYINNGNIFFAASGQGGGVWRIDSTVEASTAPSFAGACIPAEIWYREGVAIEPFTFPAAAGGVPPLAYSLEIELAIAEWWELTPPRPSLVPGLTFDSETRQLSGTPRTDLNGQPIAEYFIDSYTLEYSATDSNGSTTRLRIGINVWDADRTVRDEDGIVEHGKKVGNQFCDGSTLSFADARAPGNRADTVGSFIAALTLPEAAGGDTDTWTSPSPSTRPTTALSGIAQADGSNE